MSSDYIPRLRRELLRAGAAQGSRRRTATRVARGLRPAGVAAATALLAVAVVLAVAGGRGDEAPVGQSAGTVRLDYAVEPAGAAEEAAQVMRERLVAAGVPDPRAAVASGGGLTITVPPAARADVEALTAPGRLAVYDWERSVLGPDGSPAPADADVTGGPEAGRLATVSEAEARSRAAGRPGAQVVRAERGAPGRWYALGGEPALTNAGVERAFATRDSRGTREPSVAIDLDPAGRDAFEALTRELARRGDARAAAGAEDDEAFQHFAIVLDGQIMSVPFIHFRLEPNGIDGSNGAHIQGGLTAEDARRIAGLLSAGPLDARLVLQPEGRAGG